MESNKSKGVEAIIHAIVLAMPQLKELPTHAPEHMELVRDAVAEVVYNSLAHPQQSEGAGQAAEGLTGKVELVDTENGQQLQRYTTSAQPSEPAALKDGEDGRVYPADYKGGCQRTPQQSSTPAFTAEEMIKAAANGKCPLGYEKQCSDKNEGTCDCNNMGLFTEKGIREYIGSQNPKFSSEEEYMSAIRKLKPIHWDKKPEVGVEKKALRLPYETYSLKLLTYLSEELGATPMPQQLNEIADIVAPYNYPTTPDGLNRQVEQPTPSLEDGEKLSGLKRLKHYFGEHDKTTFEHWAFGFVVRLIKDSGYASQFKGKNLSDGEVGEAVERLWKKHSYSIVGVMTKPEFAAALKEFYSLLTNHKS